ncbi:MAG TPA: flagellar hook-length control protein FliK [Xanthobacteraceae bacterium]|nr:flagellar hook-length control protein FliK [Xanthobacteraceae bacterium]
MDLIVSPTTVALNPQQGAAVPAFKPGDIIEAQVLALIGENAARLALGKLIMEVQTQVPLLVGSTVRLAVKNTPDGIRLTLLGNAAGSASSAAGVPADGIASTPQGPGATPGAGAPVSAGNAPATAVTIATPPPATAGATGTATQMSGGAAADASASGAVSLAAGSTASGIAGAASAVMRPSADPQAAPSPSPNPVIAATAVLAAAVQSSAARQNGLAPLLADAEVAMKLAGLPEPVRQATERLLALQPTLDETTSADMIREALGRSGLFLEARLSAAVDSDMPSRPGATPGLAAGSTAAEPLVSAPPDDFKAALIVLRNVLKVWLAADTKGAGPMAAALKPVSVPAGLRAAPPLAPEGAARPDDLRLPGAAAPPPPYRGAPPAAQPAAAPSISPSMTPHEIGKVLLRETDAALARQTLLQAASLPDQAAAPPRAHDAAGPRWNFEVPFATPQGSAVAQFEIARDGHRAPAPGMKPAWRARFSLDVEPIGPVHAQIALTGTRAAVTLWAERPDTSARLRDSAPQLTDALRQAELEPGDVLVRVGSPPRPREGAPAGRFLDRAS